MTDSRTLEESVLDILELQGPSMTEEVTEMLGYRLEDGPPVDEVAGVLLALTEQRRVRFESDERWKALETAGPEGRATRELDPTASPLLVGGLRIRESEERQPPAGEAPRVPNEPDRWDLFRTLCLYYIACLREDGAPHLVGWPDRRDSSWLAFRGVPPWARLESGEQLGFSYPLTAKEAEFAKNGLQGRKKQSLFLGYPSKWVVPRDRDKSPFLMPILVWPLDVTWDLVTLRCRSDGHFRVNGAWLDGQFRKRDEARGFLDVVGLEGAGGELRFSDVVERVARYLHTEVREPLKPLEPTVPPGDLTPVKAGIYNWPLLLQGKQLKYTATLVRELKHLARAPAAELESTALASVFLDPDGGVAPAPAVPALLELKVLNSGQRDAAGAALTSPLVAITGPPGTGKSEVARAIIVNQALAGRSTLLASKNHRAIDAVAPVLNQQVGGHELVRRPRASSRDSAWFSWSDLLRTLLDSPAHGREGEFDRDRQGLSDLLARQGQTIDDIAERQTYGARWAAADDSLEACARQLPPDWRGPATLRGAALPGRETLEGLACEYRYLTANPQGIWSRFKAWLGRENRSMRLAELEATLDEFPPTGPLPDRAAESADRWAFWLLLADARAALDERENLEAAIRALPSASELGEQLDSQRHQARERGLGLLSRIAEGQHTSLRPELKTTLTNLAAAAANFGEGRVRRELSTYFAELLEHFPAWCVTNLSAGSTFPLAAGIFDLLLVDEASQCDIPSVIPLLYRAKRATFVGDPMQLRHVTNLSRSREESLLKRYGLTALDVQRFTYRENSVFNLVSSAPAIDTVHFLAHHYRCHPGIAEFVNRSFYSGRLRVATEGRRWNRPTTREAGVHWTDVRGEIVSPGRGAHCPDEVAAVVAEVVRLKAEGFKGSIGVVTPFRLQADRIRDRLHSSLDDDFIASSELEVGTAHAFQGGERDLVVFSLCSGPEMGTGKVRFVTDRNLFNVAVSRAQAVLHVFGNAAWAAESGPPFIRDLVRLGQHEPAPSADETPPYESIWEERFDRALRRGGIATVPQYSVAGRRLDLAVLCGDLRLDIEIDGETYHRGPDGRRVDDDLWRDHQLRALGWQVARFWVYELRENMEACVRRVADLIGEEDGRAAAD